MELSINLDRWMGILLVPLRSVVRAHQEILLFKTRQVHQLWPKSTRFAQRRMCMETVDLQVSLQITVKIRWVSHLSSLIVAVRTKIITIIKTSLRWITHKMVEETQWLVGLRVSGPNNIKTGLRLQTTATKTEESQTTRVHDSQSSATCHLVRVRKDSHQVSWVMDKPTSIVNNSRTRTWPHNKAITLVQQMVQKIIKECIQQRAPSAWHNKPKLTQPSLTWATQTDLEKIQQHIARLILTNCRISKDNNNRDQWALPQFSQTR